MASYMHLFTSYWYYRPVGATCIIAVYDEELATHELYMAEPNGELAVRRSICSVIFLLHGLTASFLHVCRRQRYFGVTSGKGARASKTEIEKLKVMDKTCKEALGLIAKMCVCVCDCVCVSICLSVGLSFCLCVSGLLPSDSHTFCATSLRGSLNVVHDDSKDKPFELELSWITAETGWKHQHVPKELRDEANEWAKKQLEEEEMGSDSDEDDSE